MILMMIRNQYDLENFAHRFPNAFLAVVAHVVGKAG